MAVSGVTCPSATSAPRSPHLVKALPALLLCQSHCLLIAVHLHLFLPFELCDHCHLDICRSLLSLLLCLMLLSLLASVTSPDMGTLGHLIPSDGAESSDQCWVSVTWPAGAQKHLGKEW